MKNLFKIANWCVVGIIVEAKNIIVNYKFDARFGCTCSHLCNSNCSSITIT